MGQAATQRLESAAAPETAPRVTTLLELVAIVADCAESEDEVIATVRSLINRGKVRLIGAFQGQDVKVG